VGFSQPSEGSKQRRVSKNFKEGFLKCFSSFSSVFSGVKVSQEGFSQASEGSNQGFQRSVSKNSNKGFKELQEATERMVLNKGFGFKTRVSKEGFKELKEGFQRTSRTSRSVFSKNFKEMILKCF
jgi:hypothetical protein